MQLSSEEKDLFFKVARILQRETNPETDEAMLSGMEEEFDGSDIAEALYEAAGFLEHPREITPQQDPNRYSHETHETQETLRRIRECQMIYQMAHRCAIR